MLRRLFGNSMYIFLPRRFPTIQFHRGGKKEAKQCVCSQLPAWVKLEVIHPFRRKIKQPKRGNQIGSVRYIYMYCHFCAK